jgi:hypothetical protein
MAKKSGKNMKRNVRELNTIIILYNHKLDYSGRTGSWDKFKNALRINRGKFRIVIYCGEPTLSCQAKL